MFAMRKMDLFIQRVAVATIIGNFLNGTPTMNF